MAEKTKEQLTKELDEALAEVARLNESLGFVSAEVDRLKNENQALNEQIIELSKPKKGDAKGFTELEISEKTRAGLTREQAITVLTTQREEDAAAKKAKK